MKTATIAALLAGGVILAACGGGGGGGSTVTPPTVVSPPPPPPPPPVSQAPTFTQDVFEPASTFKDQCAVPRTGSDITGQPFPDEAGSLAEELFWLRSWSEETYLWNDEIQDQDPNNFSDVLDYFDVLKTEATTASGAPRDRFHFSNPTDEYLADRLSTPEASYGISLVAFSTEPPRDFRIRYTEPNSPASEVINGQTNFVRGAQILEVDGVDLINGNTQVAVDTLNAGLFPATAGEVHTFLVQDPGAASPRTITLTSADIADAAVNRTAILNTASGDVGYILFNTFGTEASEEEIAGAITDMNSAGVTDLVVDLRYNGGGFLDIAAQLGYMIAGPARTNGKVFDGLVINDNPLNPFQNFNPNTPFHSTGQGFSLVQGTPLDDLDLGRVFILSTSRTCSASEAVINGLRGVDVEVILIGDTTCGKPYGFFPTDNCGVTYNTIQFAGTNDKGFGDYADGFSPDNVSSNDGVLITGCTVADDFDTELGDPAEGMLAAALEYRTTGACPAVSVSVASKTMLSEPGMTEVATTKMTKAQSFYANNRELKSPW